MNFKVFVISLKQEKNEKTIEKNDFTNYKIARRYIGNSKIGYTWFYFKFFLTNFFLSTYLSFKYKIKIIHYNNSPNFIILSCIIPKLFGTKLIIDNHDIVPAMVQSKFPNKFLISAARFEEKISNNFANKILCADHNQYDYLINRNFKKEKITPILNIPGEALINYIDKNEQEKIVLPNIDSDKVNMVYHGTISYRLGIDLILKSIKSITEELDNFKFHLIGKGDLLKTIKKNIIELNIEDKVIIYDKYIPYTLLPLILNRMQIGIIGNRQEFLSQYMLPVKLLEYINFKIPVIAPSNSILNRYFTKDMICFYTPENIEEMAEKILYLYKNPDARKIYAEKAFCFTKKYNYETEMKKYQDIIDHLMTT